LGADDLLPNWEHDESMYTPFVALAGVYLYLFVAVLRLRHYQSNLADIADFLLERKRLLLS